MACGRMPQPRRKVSPGWPPGLAGATGSSPGTARSRPAGCRPRPARPATACSPTACRRDGIEALALAHHLDDQAETLLHRIERGTGPDGLAGMAPTRRLDGVTLVRPLLGLPKERLVATCRAAGLAWVDDPSNLDPRFARTGYRALAGALAATGVTRRTPRAAGVGDGDGARRARPSRRRLDGGARHGHPGRNRDRWRGRRCWRRPRRCAAGWSSARCAPPAESATRPAANAWTGCWPGSRRTRPAPAARTLAGCRIERTAAAVGVLRDWRQAARPAVVEARGRLRWDGRFEIDNPTDAPVRVGVCGEEGWRRWRRTAGGLGPSAAAPLAHAARLALPAVVDLDGGIALPHLVTSAPAPFGWVGEMVRVRFCPGLPFP